MVVVTLFLGFSIAFQAAKGFRVPTLFTLIIITYIITIVYALLIKRFRHPRTLAQFAQVQIGVDLLIETVLVSVSGGIQSPFAVLYVVTVTLASLIPRKRVGLTTASVSVLLFGLVTNLQLSGQLSFLEWIEPSRLSIAETFQTFTVHGLAFIVVGFLSGALADQLRHADQSLHEKEEGLNRLQAFHENIVQSISSGVFTTDECGRITSFNPAAHEASGYSIEQVRGRPWREIFSWSQGEDYGVGSPVVGGACRFEAEGKRADGTRLVLGMTLAPLTEQGVQTGLVGVFKDLTHIRAMEEEIRRREWLSTLGEMSAGMAHEIRNPLGALTGAMQVLSQDLSLGDTNRHLMDIAIREATRLDGIIKEFLLYARPPALQLEECDLNEILGDTLDLISHEARSRKGIEIVPRLERRPMKAHVDPNQLKQVFWNLATNAFQAMPAGGRLTIGTGRRQVSAGAQTGEVVEISFCDTGMGIQKGDIDRIFLPFFTTKKEGSGLGLASIDRIVDLHGGWIRVESQEGKGALFTVCLPSSAGTSPRLWHEGRGPWKKS